MTPQNIHFIAIGGAAMHNLALALHDLGHNVTGSDDAIHDPSKGRLAASGLLPEVMGWHTERIHAGLDVVILGMHARKDNPELAKANGLKIKVVSYPEYLYDIAKGQRRIVVGGSHGKTTITAMLLHVLDQLDRPTDFMVGAQLAGFDRMVQLTGARDILLEGDEYLSSPMDLTPKFHWYRPHLTILTGVAWDHINVFPNPENYRAQFVTYLLRMEPGGSVVWFEGDPELQKVMNEVLPQRPDLISVPYNVPEHSVIEGTLTLQLESGLHPLGTIGAHNALNTVGAMALCAEWGISNAEFLRAVKGFTGAAGRLERKLDIDLPNGSCTVFRDFAHAPSKVKATTDSIKGQFPERKVIAMLELHTFSSLNPEFLPTYSKALDAADEAWVCWSPDVLKHKRLPPLSAEDVHAAFERSDMGTCNTAEEMMAAVKDAAAPNTVFLLMSSGRFDGADLQGTIEQALSL
ncbi:MAG: Mur ligase domain-containing protein [Flavobacteriales bacterium]|nr:Mur ligase domain-containing protein [Flavobacteriales bacterium]